MSINIFIIFFFNVDHLTHFIVSTSSMQSTNRIRWMGRFVVISIISLLSFLFLVFVLFLFERMNWFDSIALIIQSSYKQNIEIDSQTGIANKSESVESQSIFETNYKNRRSSCNTRNVINMNRLNYTICLCVSVSVCACLTAL